MPTITIKHQTRSIQLTLPDTSTIKDLKQHIEEQLAIPAEEQVLTLNDRILGDDRKCTDVVDGVVTVKRRPPPAAGAPPAPAPTAHSSMVKSMMQDPEAMKNMLDVLPGFKEELEKNPELRQMINNPQVLEEFEKFAENPEYLNQQQKNMDIAMSKLDKIPGGLNMMNSMMKDVRDPLADVMEGSFGKKAVLRSGERMDTAVVEPVPNPHSQRVSGFVTFRNELRCMRDVGFKDVVKNLQALRHFNGDLEQAIEYLAESRGDTEG